jgi:hypothetical protein
VGKEVRAAIKTFFNPDAVLSAAEKGRLRALSGSGAMVRGFARRSLKRAPRKSLSDMTHEERIAWERKLRHARRTGKPAPRRPLANAKPGKPPYDKNRLVKDKIFFGLTDAADDVVIGPVRFGQGTVDRLEKGGTATLPGFGGERVRMTFRGNPFMGPALDAALPKIPSLFQGIVR